MVSIWCPTSPFKTVLEESASNEDRHKNSGQNYRIELRNHSLDMNRIPEEAVEAVARPVVQERGLLGRLFASDAIVEYGSETDVTVVRRAKVRE